MSAVPKSPQVWSEAEWDRLQHAAEAALAGARDQRAPRLAVAPFARRVMRSYTSSFYLVTRFLPVHKRREVEIIYANVRYPDEVVDSFPLSPDERLERLDAWERHYAVALRAGSAPAAVQAGAPAFLAALAELIRAYQIPEAHYRSFLEAMRADVRPRRYRDMEALVDEYVYGSAVVVGYFLAHIFGASQPGHLDEALAASRELGIGLQMTNFLRDVGEDLDRGRVYLPGDRLAEEGIGEMSRSSADRRALARVVARLARENDARYAAALNALPAFAPDARPAILACIRVYRLLNEQLTECADPLSSRASIPFRTKFGALPLRKYWALPWAFLVDR